MTSKVKKTTSGKEHLFKLQILYQSRLDQKYGKLKEENGSKKNSPIHIVVWKKSTQHCKAIILLNISLKFQLDCYKKC